jgi:glucan phosphoethanolaminetransferase (alkaline phosphatase superfamily)
MIAWFTGDGKFGGVKTKDNEHSKLIKQKAIVSSWLLLLMFFLIIFLFDLLQLRQAPLNDITFKFPEPFYLLILVGSYFVYYWIYSRRSRD